MKKIKIPGYMLAVIVVVAGLIFYAGMRVGNMQSSKKLASFSNRSQVPGATRRFGGGQGFVGGTVLSLDAQSMTIKMQDGNSRIVIFGSSTEITKSASGSLQDLTAGKNVTINGKQNSDGSITAQMIQIRPSQFSNMRPTR